MSLIAYVTRIHFADRVLEDALAVELRRLGVHRPVVVTDLCDGADEARERLEDALPDDIEGQTLSVDPASGIGPAALAALLEGTGRDAVIALGGARALDLARMAWQGPGAPPLIAVPTGTSSIGLGATCFMPGPAFGRGPREARIPTVILCDPTLTLSADPAATAASGMDALTHCIEAYLGTSYNPPADGIAIEGVRRAAAFLERAVADGRDLEARREVMAAALNAGLAAQKGQGGVEAAARAVEAEAGLTARHGICHAALLPQVLSFNAPAVADRFAALGQALGLGPGADVPTALADLGARIGLPRRLSATGLGREALGRAARRAAADPANRTNPRHAAERDYLGILAAAF
jgi:4-hydroxybutyrate dehydrogenase